MVFQNYALYPHMTVFENMAFGLKLRKYPKEEIKKRVEDAAENLRLNRIIGSKASRYVRWTTTTGSLWDEQSFVTRRSF